MEEKKKNYLDKNIFENIFFEHRSSDISRIEIIIDPNMDSAGIDVSTTQDGSILINFDANDDHVYPERNFWTLRIISSDKIYLEGDWSECFWGFYSLISIEGLENLDTSEVTNMLAFFRQCSRLESLDLSTWNTSKVKNMSFMFDGCYKLASLDLSSFDTSSVTSMSEMFGGCCKLASLDLSSFDTSRVTSMSNMFDGCYKLASLDLSSFDTSRVTNMSDMFARCMRLESLDLGSWDASILNSVVNMITGCDSLKKITLNLSFDIERIKEILKSCSDVNDIEFDGVSLESREFIDNYIQQENEKSIFKIKCLDLIKECDTTEKLEILMESLRKIKNIKTENVSRERKM